MSVTIPELPDPCWPVDLSCCPDWDARAPEVQDRAVALATSSLRALTAYRVGGCPITVRPCRQRCMSSPYWFWSEGRFVPIIGMTGQWINMACGCTGDCECSSVCEVVLPGVITKIEEVRQDGVIVDPTAYRVDDGRNLVRTDGECWPICQDMSADITEPGTFAVTYMSAYPVDGLGAYAAGILACEFAKACAGAKCRLPAGVTSITRQGVSYTIASGAFPDGMTGIREVDAWISIYNPQRRTQQSTVWSPDLTRPRVTTWQA